MQFYFLNNNFIFWKRKGQLEFATFINNYFTAS
jgi:hypothetical protein